MIQLIKHNRGEVDTFTMGQNYGNTKDPAKDENETPILRTKMTLPILPVDETFKCSTLVANAENITRASQLFYEIKVELEFEVGESLIQVEKDERLRQAQLVGVGVGSPGLWLGLYGSSEFEGAQQMEARNASSCRIAIHIGL